MSDDLLCIRRAIDVLDERILHLLAARAARVAQAWALKDQMDLGHFDQNREAEILANVHKTAETLQLPPEKICAIWQLVVGLTPKG